MGSAFFLMLGVGWSRAVSKNAQIFAQKNPENTGFLSLIFAFVTMALGKIDWFFHRFQELIIGPNCLWGGREVQSLVGRNMA